MTMPPFCSPISASLPSPPALPAYSSDFGVLVPQLEPVSCLSGDAHIGIACGESTGFYAIDQIRPPFMLPSIHHLGKACVRCNHLREGCG